jgi:small basic protein (TIGR04137 family)
MSLDKSLRSRGSLVRHRNVLSRTERIELLKDAGKWDEEKDVFGLPKVAHRKVTAKKVKAAAAALLEGAEAEAAGAAAPVSGAAPAAKGGPAKAAAAPKAKGKT